MRSVTSEQDTADTVGIGDLRADGPGCDRDHLERDVGSLWPKRARISSSTLSPLNAAMSICPGALRSVRPEAVRQICDQRPPVHRSEQPMQHPGRVRTNSVRSARNVIETAAASSSMPDMVIPNCSRTRLPAPSAATRNRESNGPGAVGCLDDRDDPLAACSETASRAPAQVNQRLRGDAVEQQRLECGLRDVDHRRWSDIPDLIVLALVGQRSEAMAGQRGREPHLARQLLRSPDPAQLRVGDTELSEHLQRPRIQQRELAAGDVARVGARRRRSRSRVGRASAQA